MMDELEDLNREIEALIEDLGLEPLLAREQSDSDRRFYEKVTAAFGPAIASLLQVYAKRRVILEAARDLEPKPTGSYIGGHPFVAAGEDFSWPVNGDSGSPLTFLMQVNFADFPKLEGYPESGLIQWWIKGDDDGYGLSFEDGATGQEGILVKFYPESALSAAASSPRDPIPNSDEEDRRELGPLWSRDPVALTGTEALSFPSYEDVTVGALSDFFGSLREVLEGGDVEGAEEILEAFESATQIGGYPGFVQGDPRDPGGDRPTELILQLESIFGYDGDVLMFGDSGNAQLFGDPGALKTGDTSRIWWDWACY